MNILHMLRGIGGEPEIIRTVGAFGVVAYVIGGLVFQGWNMVAGRPFDVVAFCAAYPAGLAAAVGAVAGSVALKDKGVASAKATQAQAEQAP